MTADRRQEARREEDEEIRVVLARHGVQIEQHDKLLAALAPAAAQVVGISLRVDGHDGRFDRIETELREDLHEMRADIGAMKLAFENLRTKVSVWASLGAVAGAGTVTVLAHYLK